MASTGVNVLRWSALGVGVVYGVYHQRVIRRADRAAESKQSHEHREDLIKQARQEFAKKNAPASGSGVITNPDDPKFDLESFLKSKEAET